MENQHECSHLHDQLAANIALSCPGISLDVTCAYVDSPAESDPLTLGQGRHVELWVHRIANYGRRPRGNDILWYTDSPLEHSRVQLNSELNTSPGCSCIRQYSSIISWNECLSLRLP